MDLKIGVDITIPELAKNLVAATLRVSTATCHPSAVCYREPKTKAQSFKCAFRSCSYYRSFSYILAGCSPHSFKLIIQMRRPPRPYHPCRSQRPVGLRSYQCSHPRKFCPNVKLSSRYAFDDELMQTVDERFDEPQSNYMSLLHPILEEVEVAAHLHDAVLPAGDGGRRVRRLSLTTVVVDIKRKLQSVILVINNKR